MMAKNERCTATIMAIVAGCAAVIVLFLRIADPNLWVDEIMTYDVGTASFREHVRLVYGAYDHPPLFFHLLWLLGRVSSDPVWLSAFPALLILLAGGVAGFAVWRSEAAEIRVRALAFFFLFFALSPEIHYQAWNLRHYGLFLLVGIAYFFVWLEVLRGNGRLQRLTAVLAGLGLLTHHFMLFFIIAAEMAGGIILWRSRRSEFLAATPQRIAFFLPFALLWALIAWLQFPGSGGERIAAIMNNRGFPALAEVLARFHGSPGVLEPPRWQHYAALALGILFTILSGFRLRKSAVGTFWLAVVCVPVFLVFLLFFVQPALAPRLLLPSGTLLLAAHARTLAAMGRTGISLMAIGTLVLLSGLQIHLTHPQHFPPYAETIPKILQTVGPDEVLVLPPGSNHDVYRYYARRSDIPLPAIVAIPLPVIDEAFYRARIEELPAEVRPYRRAWVVYELPGFWDPENRVQKFFESAWIIGPYQLLWGKRWVVTYYDNPEYGREKE